MKIIYKHYISFQESFELELNKGYKILNVGLQNRAICIWVLLDTECEKVKAIFSVFGTGWSLPELSMSHIGTVQIEPLVWHVFQHDVAKEKDE